MGFVPPESILELDQEDIAARLSADEFFRNVTPVLLQRRGITENDVQVALGTMTPGQVMGTVAIVLMPTLATDAPDAPGPRGNVVYTVQVIDYPLVRRQSAGGSQVSAEQITDRVRQIIHRFGTGRGQVLYWAGQSPIQVPVGRVSYGVRFRCLSMDQPPPSCATPGISPASGTGPLSVTLSCQTAGASIYYSLDGSYPSAVGAAATPPTSFLYSAPFTADAGAFIRAVASKTDYQDGNVAQVQYN
jgi:hypothetical protein